MLKRLLLVPAAALLALGGDGLYRAAQGRWQVAIACDQFARERPASPRLLITGCEIDAAAAGFRESGGQIAELLLPARPAGTRTAVLVIATRDETAIAAARHVFGNGRSTPPAESLETVRKIIAQLNAGTVIDGLARTGIVERFRSRRILSGLAPPTGNDAVIVDLHGRPDFVWPSLAVIAGALTALAALWPVRGGTSAPEAAAHATSGGPLPVPDSDPMHASQFDPEFAFDELAVARHRHTSPAVVTPRPNRARLPQLLLLALDVSAGPEAIESAPPLGSRAEVAAILHGVIPDLDISGSPILVRPDGSVRIDLGARDPVATAVLIANGEAGVVLVKEVLLMTGWRAFAPKTGLFISVDDLDALAALAAEGPVV